MSAPSIWPTFWEMKRERDALAAEVERLRITLQDVQGIGLNGSEVGDLPEDKLFAIDLRISDALNTSNSQSRPDA